ncbi:MAG: hypothetical protein GY898_20560 [Proteobacteria bacterium]|nr:hypothetical protein [Pseudomonadota bacterium]
MSSAGGSGTSMVWAALPGGTVPWSAPSALKIACSWPRFRATSQAK